MQSAFALNKRLLAVSYFLFSIVRYPHFDSGKKKCGKNVGPVVRRTISAGVELLSGFLFLSFKSILELAGNFKLKLNLLFSPFKSLLKIRINLGLS